MTGRLAGRVEQTAKKLRPAGRPAGRSRLQITGRSAGRPESDSKTAGVFDSDFGRFSWPGKFWRKFREKSKTQKFAKIYRPTPTNFGEFSVARFFAESTVKKADYEATSPNFCKVGKVASKSAFLTANSAKKRMAKNSPKFVGAGL